MRLMVKVGVLKVSSGQSAALFHQLRIRHAPFQSRRREYRFPLSPCQTSDGNPIHEFQLQIMLKYQNLDRTHAQID
jgi:hypothetical protein